jgi:hypothetical protein
MPQGRFNEYSPQEQLALARDLLQKSGRPLTANNLNAAMIALMRNEQLPSNNMDAAIERSMQPRRQPAPRQQAMQAPQRDVRMLNQDVDAEAALADGDPNADGNPSMRDIREAGVVVEPTAAPVVEPVVEPDLAAEFPGGGGSHSNVGGNTTVEQAITRMLLPAIIGMGMVPGGMVGAARNASQYVGRAPFRPGPVRDVPPSSTNILSAPSRNTAQPRTETPAPRAETPAPQAQQTRQTQQASKPSERVSSERQGQGSLPRPDADLRRRMIERNTQRSERNAARTRDERAAGNNNKGRRERIERVPEGEVAPARKSSTIRLPPSRRRVSETSGNRRDAVRDEQ